MMEPIKLVNCNGLSSSQHRYVLSLIKKPTKIGVVIQAIWDDRSTDYPYKVDLISKLTEAPISTPV